MLCLSLILLLTSNCIFSRCLWIVDEDILLSLVRETLERRESEEREGRREFLLSASVASSRSSSLPANSMAEAERRS